MKAKQIFSNWRYYVLFVLFALTIIGIVCVPDKNLPMRLIDWLYILISSKLLAVYFGYTTYKLYKNWAAKNLIPELVELFNHSAKNIE